MGVINLGLLVDKIKKKLENSGFIKNTDYATASATGVVQIGDNVDVSSAGVISVPIATAEDAGVVKVGDGLSITEAGVLSASGGGGFTFEKIYEAPDTPVGQNTAITLTKTSDDYKMLVIILEREGAMATHIMVPHPQNITMKCAGGAPNDATAYNWSYTANGTTLTCNAGNSGNKWSAVYGIK